MPFQTTPPRGLGSFSSLISHFSYDFRRAAPGEGEAPLQAWCKGKNPGQSPAMVGEGGASQGRKVSPRGAACRVEDSGQVT